MPPRTGPAGSSRIAVSPGVFAVIQGRARSTAKRGSPANHPHGSMSPRHPGPPAAYLGPVHRREFAPLYDLGEPPTHPPVPHRARQAPHPGRTGPV